MIANFLNCGADDANTSNNKSLLYTSTGYKYNKKIAFYLHLLIHLVNKITASPLSVFLLHTDINQIQKTSKNLEGCIILFDPQQLIQGFPRKGSSHKIKRLTRS